MRAGFTCTTFTGPCRPWPKPFDPWERPYNPRPIYKPDIYF